MNLIDVEIKTRDFPGLDQKVRSGTASADEINRHAEMLSLKNAYQASLIRDGKVFRVVAVVLAFLVLWLTKEWIDSNTRGDPTFYYLMALLVIIQFFGLLAKLGQIDEREKRKKTGGVPSDPDD